MKSDQQLLLNYLAENKERLRIHISEIIKDTSIPEEKIKKQLLELTKTKPEIGKFDYPTGWLERPESPRDQTQSIRLAWAFFIMGLILLLFGPIIGLLNFTDNQWIILLLMTISFLGFWILLSSIIYLLKLYRNVKDSELTVFATWRRLKP
ncbi:MAG: hypothetical protein ACFFDC_01990 [Promethearchaeota archaeon]